jgi:hypothetical protein
MKYKYPKSTRNPKSRSFPSKILISLQSNPNTFYANVPNIPTDLSNLLHFTYG